MRAKSSLQRFLRGVATLAIICAAVLCPQRSRAANILWVNDFFTDNSFAPPGTGVNDTNFITILQNAGHNVIRFNPPASQNTALTAAQITAINTNDLIIAGRACDSTAFQTGIQCGQWNTNITKPLMMNSCYLLRASRLGWFTAEVVTPDGTPGPMNAVNLNDPKTAYLFATVAMSGNNTVDPFDVAVDRNISLMFSTPVSGGTVLARSVSGSVGTVIADFPAGTVVKAGAHVLAGYRMFFACGSREAASPGGVANSGKDNLTATGKAIFLRAVEIAINNGNVAAIPGAPTNLTGLALSAQVQLNWATVPTASGYYVKRALVTGGPYTNVGTNTSSTNTSYADFTVVNDTTYYYVVSAFNGAGESTISTEIAVTPKNAPANLVAVGGTNQVTVSWDALAGASTYTVKRSGASVGPFSTVGSGIAGTSFLDTIVASGQTYYYVVVAQLTLGGDSGQSLTVSATTAPGTPALNTVLFATTVIRVGWTSGGQVVSQYFLESSPDGINFSPLVTLPGTALSYTNSGLSLDTTYYYRVRAMNVTGPSAYSNIGTNRTPVGGYNVNISNSGNSSQNATPAPAPPGYLVDEGEVFGDRTNGFFYGWTTVGGTNITRDSRWRQNPISPDLRYDTGNQFMKNNVNNPATTAIWDFQLPNGFYSVHAVSGDADAIDSVFQFNIEGVNTAALSATNVGHWAEFTVSVGVSDGRLTIKAGPQAVNHKFCFVDIYPAVATPPVLTGQPQSQTVEENRPATLTTTNITGSPTLVYQWYRNDTLVTGATNPTLSFVHTPTSAQGDYYLVVTNYGGAATSSVATLTVTPDTTPPFIIGAGSLDGNSIGVCFNEEVDLTALGESSNYQINHGDYSIARVVARPDGRSAIIQVEGTVSGPFSIQVTSMTDLAGQFSNFSETNGTVLGFTVGDVGPTLPGTNFTCDGVNIELVGGGADVWSTNDQFYLASKTITGDFDAKVRVTGLAGANAITKAVLVARETRETNSAALHVSVNPVPPGRNQFQMGQRPATDATSVGVGTNFGPAGIPDAWMRLTRAGNVFTGFRSSNGVDWVQLGQTNQTFPSSMVVGLGVTAHDNTLLATGTFQNFTIQTSSADLAVTKVAAPSAVFLGANVTFDVAVTNRGPDASAGTVVTDVLPSGVSFVSATPSQGSCSFAAGTVTCTLGTINSGSSASISIVMHPSSSGSVTNTATVAASTADTNTVNNSATAVAHVLTMLPHLGNPIFSGGIFTASLQTEVGPIYEIQYSHSAGLSTPCNSIDFADIPCPNPPVMEPWFTLTNIVGDGALKTFTDPFPASDRRFYRTLVH